MAEPTKADLAGALEERLRAVEATASEVRGAVGMLKWVLGISIPIAIAAGAWLFSLATDAKTSAAVHATELTRLDKTISERAERLERLIEKLDTQSRHRAEAPQASGQWCLEGNTGCYIGSFGVVAQVRHDSIVLQHPPDLVKTEYPIDAGARVLVKGQGAKIEDLKPGMTIVAMYPVGSKVQFIGTVEPSETPHKLPAPPKTATE